MIAAKDPRHDSSPRATIVSAETTTTILNITWGDGHSSTFHNIWLRDNCTCDNARVLHARTAFNGNRHVRLLPSAATSSTAAGVNCAGV